MKREQLFHEIHRDRQTSAETSAFLLDGEDLKKVKSCEADIILLSLPLFKRAKDKVQPTFHRDVIKPLL